MTPLLFGLFMGWAIWGDSMGCEPRDPDCNTIHYHYEKTNDKN